MKAIKTSTRSFIVTAATPVFTIYVTAFPKKKPMRLLSWISFIATYAVILYQINP